MKETKYCKPCNTNLPLEDFGPHPGTKDRLQNYCRVCQAERAASMRDQHHELDAIRNSARYLERHEARRAEEAEQGQQRDSEISFEFNWTFEAKPQTQPRWKVC